jgi:hypothetical protein
MSYYWLGRLSKSQGTIFAFIPATEVALMDEAFGSPVWTREGGEQILWLPVGEPAYLT